MSMEGRIETKTGGQVAGSPVATMRSSKDVGLSSLSKTRLGEFFHGLCGFDDVRRDAGEAMFGSSHIFLAVLIHRQMHRAK